MTFSVQQKGVFNIELRMPSCDSIICFDFFLI